MCDCSSKVFIKRKSAQLGACYDAKGFKALLVRRVSRGVLFMVTFSIYSVFKCSDRALHKFALPLPATNANVA